MRRTVSVSTEVDVDVDVRDVLNCLNDAEAIEVARIVLPRTGVAVPFGLGEGDTSIAERFVEQAYLAARRVPDLPREIADLFWHVHGRAIA